MAQVILFFPPGTDADFLRESLVSAGHHVDVSGPARADAPLPENADVAVYEGVVAVARGWFREVDPTPLPKVPVVIASEFAGLLEVIAGQVAATLALPSNAAAVNQAIQVALRGVRATARTRRGTLVSNDRDEAVAPFAAAPSDPELYGIVGRMQRALRVPMALVTVVDSKRQTFIAEVGMPADLRTAAGTARSWSFCQHAVEAALPLVVSDARDDPRFAGTPLVTTGLVRSYAGVPVVLDGVGAVGTVCAISDQPRSFTDADLAVLDMAARLVASRLQSNASGAAAASRAQPGTIPGVGELFDGKYWVTASLGEGGQGSVLLARDRLLGQLVAIKVVDATAASEEALLREARALASVKHPNLVGVQGWGTVAGRIYIVLEYVAGETIADRLQPSRGGEDVTFALARLKEIAGALAQLHAAGLAHGDVKPQNVIYDASFDRAVLIDLGLSSAMSADRAEKKRQKGGTPGYSAPEQFFDDRVTSAADVYGFVATAYALLCGRGPFDGRREHTRMGSQLRGEFTPVSKARPGLPATLDAVFVRGLAADPDLRPASVLEVVAEIEAALAAPRPAATSRSSGHPPAAAENARSTGRIFRAWRVESQAALGAASERALFARLPAAAREVFDAITDDEAFYPASGFASYIREVITLGPRAFQTIAGAMAARIIPGILTQMHLTRTEESLFHAIPDIVLRNHDWISAATIRTSADAATLTLHMPTDFAPAICTLYRGVLQAGFAMMGAPCDATDKRCLAHGDPECVIALAWNRAAKPSARATGT